MKRFQSMSLPAVLAINKIDLLEDKSRLMEQIAEFSKLFAFEAVVPVSAQDGNGVKDALLPELKKLCQPGGHMFPDDTLTDQPERVLAAEIIREKLLRLLEGEVPHGTAVFVERMREREDSDITDIDAVIFCERESHKGIIIGKGGSMLKKGRQLFPGGYGTLFWLQGEFEALGKSSGGLAESGRALAQSRL